MDLFKYTSQIKYKSHRGVSHLFDPIRRKWIKTTPEELVRQCIISYLIEEKSYPVGLISVEKEIKFHQLNKRYDIVIYTKDVSPLILIECKAPEYSLSHHVNEQISIYQQVLKGQYLWLSNGRDNHIYEFDQFMSTYRVLADIPSAIT